MISIVPFDNNHLDDVTALEKLCFSLPWSKEMFADELKSNLAHYLVAIDEVGRVVGYVGMWKILDEGHITNVAVSPKYRLQGIGERLICELINISKRLELSMLTLEVRESNITAQRLYSKYLFKQVGIRKKYYSDTNEDALIMTLCL